MQKVIHPILQLPNPLNLFGFLFWILLILLNCFFKACRLLSHDYYVCGKLVDLINEKGGLNAGTSFDLFVYIIYVLFEKIGFSSLGGFEFHEIISLKPIKVVSCWT